MRCSDAEVHDVSGFLGYIPNDAEIHDVSGFLGYMPNDAEVHDVSGFLGYIPNDAEVHDVSGFLGYIPNDAGALRDAPLDARSASVALNSHREGKACTPKEYKVSASRSFVFTASTSPAPSCRSNNLLSPDCW